MIYRPDLSNVLTTLSEYIGHDYWFIAGSYAVPEVQEPSDIDVYFLTQEVLDHALQRLSGPEVDPNDPFVHTSNAFITDNAVSTYIGHLSKPVQFIKKHVGLPHEVLKHFDINVCKQAILPDGSRYVDPLALEPLHICELNICTFRRVFKYANYLGYSTPSTRFGREAPLYDTGFVHYLIDNFIQDSRIIEDYYDDVELKQPTNRCLYEAVHAHASETQIAYLNQQAEIHAPELLL